MEVKCVCVCVSVHATSLKEGVIVGMANYKMGHNTYTHTNAPAPVCHICLQHIANSHLFIISFTHKLDLLKLWTELQFRDTICMSCPLSSASFFLDISTLQLQLVLTSEINILQAHLIKHSVYNIPNRIMKQPVFSQIASSAYILQAIQRDQYEIETS